MNKFVMKATIPHDTFVTNHNGRSTLVEYIWNLSRSGTDFVKGKLFTQTERASK